jgi:hypothetical protein
LSSGGWHPVRPGGVFVVASVVAEAAVQDADKSVAQSAQGLMMGVAGGAMLVIEGPCTAAGQQGGEGPLVDGGIEAAVAYMAGQYRAFLAGFGSQG